MTLATRGAIGIVAAMFLATTATADGYKRIRKADDFNKFVVGKKITFDGGTATIWDDGKTDGKLKKSGKYHGAWVWKNGYYCRNLFIKGKETGTKCLKVEIDGSKLRMTHDKGKGRSIEARLK